MLSHVYDKQMKINFKTKMKKNKNKMMNNGKVEEWLKRKDVKAF